MPGTNKEAPARAWGAQGLVRACLLMYALAGAGHWLGWWDLDALARGGPDLCVFHRLTGWDCPGCGMGRSLALLIQGRWRDSWNMHPLGGLFVAWMLVWAALPARAVRALRERPGRLVRALPVLALGLVLVRWAAHLSLRP